MGKKNSCDNRRIQQISRAMEDAAKQAREVASATGTPLIVWKDGAVQEISVASALPEKPVAKKKSKPRRVRAVNS